MPTFLPRVPRLKEACYSTGCDITQLRFGASATRALQWCLLASTGLSDGSIFNLVVAR